jgi:hypothetical protein
MTTSNKQCPQGRCVSAGQQRIPTIDDKPNIVTDGKKRPSVRIRPPRQSE